MLGVLMVVRHGGYYITIDNAYFRDLEYLKKICKNVLLLLLLSFTQFNISK